MRDKSGLESDCFIVDRPEKKGINWKISRYQDGDGGADRQLSGQHRTGAVRPAHVHLQQCSDNV